MPTPQGGRAAALPPGPALLSPEAAPVTGKALDRAEARAGGQPWRIWVGLTDCPEGPGPLDSQQRVAADSCTLAQNGRSDSHHEVPSVPPYHTLRALWATAATAAP